MVAFADRLRALREKEGVQQQEMATKLNIPRSTYNNYETGKREPTLDTVKLIADYFEVTSDYLLGRTDNPRTVLKFDIPQELKEIGVQYLVVAKQIQDEKISPEEAQAIIEAIQAYKKANRKG